MNETINLSGLIKRVSDLTGADINTTRRFIRELTSAIQEGLAHGEPVDAGVVGIFRRVEGIGGGDTEVAFKASDTLARGVNHAFAMFEAVELAEGVSEQDLEEETPEMAAPPAEPEAEKENNSGETTVCVDQSETAPDTETAREPEIARGKDIEDNPEPEPTKESDTPVETTEPSETLETSEPSEPSEEPTAETPGDEGEPPADTPFATEPDEAESPWGDEEEDTSAEAVRHRPYEERPLVSRWWFWVIIALLAAVAGYVAAIFADTAPGTTPEPQELIEDLATDETEPIPSANEPTAEGEPEAIAETSETPAPSGETPAPEPVYETVGAHNYLSVISRRHYGVQTYWIFIYEANRDVLRDPDHIAPGTRVVVPPLESLPGGSDAERREIAAQKISQMQRH